MTKADKHKTYYVYVDRTDSGIPYYVGMGDKHRMQLKKRNEKHDEIMTLHGFNRVVEAMYTDEALALDKEAELIEKYGTHIKTEFGCNTILYSNHNHIGPNTGKTFSQDWKDKLAAAKRGKPGNKLGKVAFPGGFRWKRAVRQYAEDFPMFPISDNEAVEAIRGGCVLCHFCDTGDSQLRAALKLYIWREGDDLKVFCKGCRPRPKLISWETREAWSAAGKASRGRIATDEARAAMSRAQKERFSKVSDVDKKENNRSCT